MEVVASVCNRLTDFTIEEYGLLRNQKEEVESLRSAVFLIKGLLHDADEKQARDGAVRVWLGQLKLVLFDAEKTSSTKLLPMPSCAKAIQNVDLSQRQAQGKLRIKNDDKLIQAEGVESLSEFALRQACRERGYLGLLSKEEMCQQLRDWLDLSLNHSVPSSLLILSRAFTVSGKIRPEEAIVATLLSLPDEVVDTVGTGLPSEDYVSQRRRKLEFLEMQEELIKEEVKEKEKEEKAKMDPAISQEDVALSEMTIPTTRETQDLAKAKLSKKHDQFCNISRALAVLASASSVSREREEFLSLVNKEIELYNSMLEKEGTAGEEEAKKAYRAAREESNQAAGLAAGHKVSSALIDRVDAMLQKLEKEIDDVDATIGNRWQLLDRDHDGKVTPEEVASAAMYLKDTLGRDGIQELISNLSKDKEGKILVEDILKLGSKKDDATTDKVENL